MNEPKLMEADTGADLTGGITGALRSVGADTRGIDLFVIRLSLQRLVLVTECMAGLISPDGARQGLRKVEAFMQEEGKARGYSEGKEDDVP